MYLLEGKHSILDISEKHLLFSSPELKVQVSFSDHLLSVVCLSVRLSVCKLLTLIFFSRTTGPRSTNLGKKVSPGEGDSSMFKWRAKSFSRGDNCKIVKINWKLKNLLLQNHWSKLNPNSWVKGSQVCFNEGPHPS